MTPYLQGRDAFLSGEALSQCPYDRHTHSLSFRLWRNGWADAERASHEAVGAALPQEALRKSN